MGKDVIFAVAGSGKTSLIIDKLTLTEKSLIVTYTRANIANLKKEIIRKFGHFPDNIKLLPYFTFIYSFCLRPVTGLDYRFKGIIYEPNPNRRIRQSSDRYFITSNGYVYSNRITKFLAVKGLNDLVNSRIEKYFDNVFIDEIQDFSGHDFNFLGELAKLNIPLLCVGDFHQHTFDTSQDGNVNRGLHDDITAYETKFEEFGFVVDKTSLDKTHRCSPSVCEFIRNNIGINILSHRTDSVEVSLIEEENRINELFEDQSIVKLFYQLSHRYPCYSKNWGDSKGENHYEDVCVVLNDRSYQALKNRTLSTISKRTLNKLYVACSRARGRLFLIPERPIKDRKTN